MTTTDQKKHMIVVRADESSDCDHAIPAGTIFDDNGLTPALIKLFGNKACTDIGA